MPPALHLWEKELHLKRTPRSERDFDGGTLRLISSAFCLLRKIIKYQNHHTCQIKPEFLAGCQPGNQRAFFFSSGYEQCFPSGNFAVGINYFFFAFDYNSSLNSLPGSWLQPPVILIPSSQDQTLGYVFTGSPRFELWKWWEIPYFGHIDLLTHCV